ncbi:hypothetical protein CBS115989_10923 [Aspergillus niger]|uniref:Contig An12c0220, genomic contig n=2 Tax=Aspergillus niger TaxID=5061 RepID=A2R014_ASPNC|nr:uncharacterized protein An12g06980 [Aspergillus niger]KAI2811966.1 hypothetical protein CBS115989_10923 [Aspergillus niger]KAI2837796.1 hypothetical protein CBS11232_9824 [Aspergillus niger]KAI2868067.1 hypothetical protein CBS115988_10939 [Aspergillus niger]CAK46328.1 unnamed protein product [Aspergillus niger]|eukprot:XP_001395753.1 hypothetical protein ANI_1_828104 [Aspergillus niger CBS 513.88]
MFFYRVTDKDSVAAFEPGQGFIAGNTSSRVTLDPLIQDDAIELVEYIQRHLNWKNRYPTPFISAYLDFDTAKTEALRRVNDGKKSVVLWKICLDEDDDLEWATIYDLKRELGFWIQDNAFHNAKYEALFVRKIPRDYVVRGERYTNRQGKWTGGKWFHINHPFH